MTHAAFTRRLLEGGWPWLLTKRSCLGGGIALVELGVAMMRKDAPVTWT